MLSQTKLVVLIGLFKALRCSEIYDLQFSDITREYNFLIVTIRSSKADKKEQDCPLFFLNEEQTISALKYYDQYLSIVPSDLKIWPCFFNIQHPRKNSHFPKVIKRRKEINWFGEIPQQISTTLKKVDAKIFTGHSLRRTAAIWLAAHGISEIQLQTFGRWKSTSVVLSYIAES